MLSDYEVARMLDPELEAQVRATAGDAMRADEGNGDPGETALRLALTHLLVAPDTEERNNGRINVAEH